MSSAVTTDGEYIILLYPFLCKDLHPWKAEQETVQLILSLLSKLLLPRSCATSEITCDIGGSLKEVVPSQWGCQRHCDVLLQWWAIRILSSFRFHYMHQIKLSPQCTLLPITWWSSIAMYVLWSLRIGNQYSFFIWAMVNLQEYDLSLATPFVLVMPGVSCLSRMSRTCPQVIQQQPQPLKSKVSK